MTAAGDNNPHLADAKALDQWAERYAARFEFATIVRRLIQQTNRSVSSLDMRSDEGVGFGGYDGVISAATETPFVPDGESVWELGVGEDPASKANDDYKKRTKDSLGVDKTATTFVFVTPRVWSGKTKWADERRAEGEWKDVRAFDAEDLVAALEQAPGVHYWVSAMLGLPVDGVEAIEHWWERLAASTNPNLTPALVLAGRNDEAELLISSLSDDAGFTTLSAVGPIDMLAFAAAALKVAEAEGNEDLISRTLIVYDEATLRRLERISDRLILVLRDPGLAGEAMLANSHHVVLFAPDGTASEISLRAIDALEFEGELKSIGVDDELAQELGLVARRSLVAFQVETSPRGNVIRTWGEQLASRNVRRALLAGGWQDVNEGDTQVIANLCETGYDAIAEELLPYTANEDPIFLRVGPSWKVASVAESWRYAIDKITAADLDVAEQAIQEVLGETDPALDLPIEDRWAAAIYGKEWAHSSHLRHGLANTIAAAGAFGEEHVFPRRGSISDWAAKMVARLLDRANQTVDASLWASLNDVLPLLAEAAPAEFLEAVEKGLTSDEPLLAGIFIDSQGDFLTGRNSHTGMLWALEALSWSSDHAARAISALARLSEIDPGGRYSNRPSKSLEDIFRVWMPQTPLSPERRLDVLDNLRRKHGGVAWKLMLSMLPEFHSVGHFTHAPGYRSWKPEEEARPSNLERYEITVELCNRLIEDANGDGERWRELAEHIDQFPPTSRTKALEQLVAESEGNQLGDEQLLVVWRELEQQARRHRSFQDADWAMPEAQIEAIEEVIRKLAPKHSIEKHRWLFDEQFPDLGSRYEDYAAQEQKLDEARTAALREVVEDGGFARILELAQTATQPWTVGVTAAALAPEEDATAIDLLDSDDASLRIFAEAWCRRRSLQDGFEFQLEQQSRLDGRDQAQARLLLSSSDLETAWKAAEELGAGVEAAYWSEFSSMGRGADFQLANEAARKLLDFDRPTIALDMLNLYARKEDRRVSEELVVEALNAVIEMPEDAAAVGAVSPYEIDTLLDYLRDGTTSNNVIAGLEWKLLPGLSFDARSPALELEISRDPKLFADLVSLAYRPRPKEKDVAEEEADQSTEQELRLARNANKLLDGWRIVPGSEEDHGPIDPEQLEEWVEKARALLDDADRGDVGDLLIGHILARAGYEDGNSPPSSVCKVIDDLANERIDRGFRQRLYNDRGTTTRGPRDGGDQERALAADYKKRADKIRDKWPRTAANLDSLAKDYERDARRHDEDAERLD